MDAPKTGAIYIRYSSAGQDRATLENQEEKCRAAMNKAGVELYKIYADAAKSAAPGKANKRPAYAEMMEDAASGLFQYLYIYNSNRLSREESIDALAMINSLNRMGVKVVSASEEQLPPDLAESDYGDLLWLISAKENNRYITNLQSAVSDNMARALKAGYWVNGTTPYGYDRIKVYDERDEKQRIKLIVNEEEAKVVRRIYQLYVERKPQKEIARILQREGYKPRGYTRRNTETGRKEKRQNDKWAQPRIAEVLGNEVYSGIIPLTITKRKGEKVLNVDRIDYEVPVIVPRELYLQAQAIRETNKRPAGKRQAQSDRPFAGLGVCAECGRRLVSNYLYKRIALVCSSRKYKHQRADETKYECCNKQYLDETMLVSSAKSMLKMAFISPKRCRELYDKAYTKKSAETKSIEERKALYESEITKRERTIKGYTDAFADDPCNPAKHPSTFITLTLKLEGEMKEFQNKIDALHDERAAIPNIPDDFQGFWAWWQQRLNVIDTLSGADLRHALEEVGFRIVSHADGRIEMGLNGLVDESEKDKEWMDAVTTKGVKAGNVTASRAKEDRLRAARDAELADAEERAGKSEDETKQAITNHTRRSAQSHS